LPSLLQSASDQHQCKTKKILAFLLNPVINATNNPEKAENIAKSLSVSVVLTLRKQLKRCLIAAFSLNFAK
jgi:hypothetical protein